ncbi:DUF4393 domain-containing protein [Jatrophihabitans sp.]|uniref:DUF4393 domain-containing protein n=1 Tax=Jatrophihabitans sp. TaxID=1932789 RepID=UPI0030C6D62D|nr:hypothetical protein [Jatrophihabitans sp.]
MTDEQGLSVPGQIPPPARPGTDLPTTAAELIKAAPGVAKVAVASSVRLAGWTANASLAGAGYVVRRAVAGETATSIMQEAANDLRGVAWRALGLIGPPSGSTSSDRSARGASAEDLRRRGSELMRRSNDVHVVEDTHPAFGRILSEITPDEARVLRFLYLDGPQPSIDIRTNRPFGIGSELIADGLNMIAEHAGCRNVDRIHPYLTNLARLGLVEFSKEQVSNPQRYQVVEAQPKVTQAMKRAGRMPRAVHRSIFLSEFGKEFCRACLPIGDVRVVNGEAANGRPRPYL